jgi:hypothetical protein
MQPAPDRVIPGVYEQMDMFATIGWCKPEINKPLPIAVNCCFEG